MAQGKKGHVVNIGSVAGRFSNKAGALYSGTKSEIRAILDGWRKDVTANGALFPPLPFHPLGRLKGNHSSC
jgi:NADP-dependent 3-hydroxy acid dehydrogenase YdfG